MIIYKTTNIVNRLIYIGQHECGYRCRKLCRYLGSGTSFNKALEEYGREKFLRETLEIVDENKNELEVWEIEESYIVKYDARNPLIGYNIAKAQPSFFLGSKHTNKTKDKISKKAKGHRTWNKGLTKETDERLRKMGEASKGRPGAMKGKHHSKESKEKISKVHLGNKYNLGRKASEETKEKMRVSAKNRPPISDETRNKISKSKSGPNNHNFGKKASKETKEKMSISQTGENNGFFGKAHTEEVRKIISEANKNKVFTEEIRKRMSESHKGKSSGMKGKKRKPESIVKAKETKRKNKFKKVVQDIIWLLDIFINKEKLSVNLK